jgi:hypothetical protein
VNRWLLEELTPAEATILGIAMRHHLQERGPDVVETRYGRALGGGLFEFRLDDTVDDVLGRLGLKRKHKLATAPTRALLFRVFFHVHGARVILLLGGYDKGRQPSKRYQQRQIALARLRLIDWKRRKVASS